MKKKLLTYSSLVALSSLSIQAAIIAEDDFSYSTGGLAGNNGGSGWSGAWVNTNSAGVSVGDDSGDGFIFGTSSGRSARDLSVAIGGAGSDGTSVFVGIDYQFGSEFNALEARNDGDAANVKSWAFGAQTASLDGFILGSDDGNNAGVALASGTDAIARYVIEFNFGAGDTDSATLYQNGTVIGSTTASYDFSFSELTFAAFVNPVELAHADNLIIATTYAEAASIPEPSAFASLVGGLSLAVACRRRKRA